MEQKTEKTKRRKKCNFFQCDIEKYFYRVGHGVASHPKKAIVAAILICIITSLGNLCWYEELDEVELFLSQDSTIRKNSIWVRENFPDDIRFESMIIVADNIIRPDIFQAIWEIEQDIKAINVSGQGWEDVCAGFKSLFPDKANNSIEDNPLLGNVDNSCLYQSILKPWTNANETDFQTMEPKLLNRNFTKQLSKRVLSALDNMKLMVSGISRERAVNKTTALVKSAKATILTFMLKKDHPLAMEWELEFLKKTLKSKHNCPPDMKIYAVATRSYKDTLQNVLNNNLTIFFAGFSLIIFYVIVMLSRFNMIQHRVYLSLVSVAVVGMSISSSFGTCFVFGLTWGPIHPILPFLLLGIGVDNTFVILQCLDNIRSLNGDSTIQVRIGKALQQAGVSISITSLTDILAFAVGTSSSMPFLRSFSIFAWTGILFLYFYVNVLLVGSLAMDENRIEDRRDGFCCLKREWKPNPCSSRNIQRDFFAHYFAPFLVRPSVKVLVIFLTLSVFAVNAYCIFLVEQKFDPNWYLNRDSYPIQFNDKLNEYFPRYGKRSAVFLGGIDYYNEKEKLYELMNQLEANRYINSDTLEFWFTSFHEFLKKKKYEPEDDEEFKSYLTEFLISENGQHFLNDMKFNKVPVNDYQILTSRIPIQHIMMNSTSEQAKTIESINEIIKNSNLTTDNATLVSFSPEYVSWTANQIIGQELIRNLCITLGAVGAVTFLLIRNFRTAMIVNLCVIFTVVDLVGSLYWLGLTIEISTSILSILCAGLAVDYAAHIGYEFTRVSGTRNERSIKTVSLLGSAVFNGGFSTFLAFVLLSGSNSYLFTTFFKLFTGVVTFGVWHGLCFLPVVLSICGPLYINPEQKSPSYLYQNGHYDTSRNKNGSPPLSPGKDELNDCNSHQISRLLDNNSSETNDCNNKELISIHVISDLKNQNISPNQHKRNHSLEENCVPLEDNDNENS